MRRRVRWTAGRPAPLAGALGVAVLVAVYVAWSGLMPTPVSGQAPVNPLGLKVHHITASVTDVDRAARWYQEMLGFTLRERGSRQNGAFQFAELEIPGFGVALVQNGGGSAAAAARAPGSAAWVHIVFAVTDPAQLFGLLKQRGAKVTTRATPPAAIQSFLVDDSEGNEIEIVAAAP